MEDVEAAGEVLDPRPFGELPSPAQEAGRHGATGHGHARRHGLGQLATPVPREGGGGELVVRVAVHERLEQVEGVGADAAAPAEQGSAVQTDPHAHRTSPAS